MIEKYGDLFTTEARYIGHGVNCWGKMGAGIAKQFRERYPKMYEQYVTDCRTMALNPGGFSTYRAWDDARDEVMMVVNLASQDQPGPVATYEHLFNSLNNFGKHSEKLLSFEKVGSTLAIPEIGCGIGGLEWNKAKTIIEAVEILNPHMTVEVWHYA